MRIDLAGHPHHDGSRRYVDRDGDRIDTIRMVVPIPESVAAASIRLVHSGDATLVAGSVERADAEGAWWTFPLAGMRPPFAYSFVLSANNGRTFHLNACGLHSSEQIGRLDFTIGLESDTAPDWARRARTYYVFLDRFDRADVATDGAFDDWTQAVATSFPDNVRQFYGGNLAGVERRLDYLQNLGIDTLILSPFFPAPESHRYCSRDFDVVDGLLGGNAALASLTAEAHRRGMYCIGDFTLNHCGDEHVWFRCARSGAAERDLFYFDDEYPGGYATYRDVATLPKFNYENAISAERLYGAADAPVRRWLTQPYALDGWRLDAAAMVGRHGRVDRNAEVAVGVRRAIREVNPDAFHFAEILHDPADDLADGRWSGSVLCAGFATPVRAMASGDQPIGEVYRALLYFAAELSWQCLTSSVTFVGSHDLPRIRTVSVCDRAALAAHFLLFTYPGIPMIYGGDEMGVEGATCDSGRRPLPWQDRESLTGDYSGGITSLIRLRERVGCLSDGGLRWLAAAEDVLCFERCDDRGGRVICALAPAAGTWTIRATGSGFDLVPLLEVGLEMVSVESCWFTLASAEDWAFGVWRVDGA